MLRAIGNARGLCRGMRQINRTDQRCGQGPRLVPYGLRTSTRMNQGQRSTFNPPKGNRTYRRKLEGFRLIHRLAITNTPTGTNQQRWMASRYDSRDPLVDVHFQLRRNSRVAAMVRMLERLSLLIASAWDAFGNSPGMDGTRVMEERMSVEVRRLTGREHNSPKSAPTYQSPANGNKQPHGTMSFGCGRLFRLG
jgi:hypothetical protein